MNGKLKNFANCRITNGGKKIFLINFVNQAIMLIFKLVLFIFPFFKFSIRF
jgi:hypothetical protein